MARRRKKSTRRSFPWLTVVFFLSTCALGYVVAVDALSKSDDDDRGGFEALDREPARDDSEAEEIESLRKRIRQLESELDEKEAALKDAKEEADDLRMRLAILESRLTPEP